LAETERGSEADVDTFGGTTGILTVRMTVGEVSFTGEARFGACAAKAEGTRSAEVVLHLRGTRRAVLHGPEVRLGQADVVAFSYELFGRAEVIIGGTSNSAVIVTDSVTDTDVQSALLLAVESQTHLHLAAASDFTETGLDFTEVLAGSDTDHIRTTERAACSLAAWCTLGETIFVYLHALTVEGVHPERNTPLVFGAHGIVHKGLAGENALTHIQREATAHCVGLA